MSKETVSLTGVERTFRDDELIVSKTDLKGRLTYTNQTFLKIADYSEKECLGQPHSMIRHPDMPRCVFKLLWETISNGREIFAYVINKTKFGDHYWVFAHVTPTFDQDGKSITGYHSNRRVPDGKALNVIKPLYDDLRQVEAKHANAKEGLEASYRLLLSKLADTGMEYDEFIQSL